MKSKAGKAKACKDKEPKAILDVTQAGTDMVQRKGISAFVTGLKYKAVQCHQWKVRRCSTCTAALAGHQQFMHHARNTCHACVQGHVQSSFAN